MLVFTGSLKAQTKFSPYKSDVIIYSGYSFPIFPESDEWKNADRSLNSTTTTSQRSNQIVDIVSRKQSQREQMKEYYSKNGTTEIIVNFEL